jgi:hypothetical protein
MGIGCILSFLTPAHGAPTQVRVSFLGSAANIMGVAWNTKSGHAEAQLKVGTSKGSYRRTVRGQTTALGPPLGTLSEVTLTKLSPSTTYYYRVGGPRGGWSQEHSFRTGPAEDPRCGAARFAFIGDSRADSWQGDRGASDLWPRLVTAALRRKAAFFVHGGDIVHDGRRNREWDNHLTATAPFSASTPFMYTIGNHDDGPVEGDGANFNKVFFLPRSKKSLGGSGTEDHYYFTYGNAIFVVLSSVSFSGGSIPFSNQAGWLDRVLTRHRKRWKFVTLHHPIYTQYMFINHEPNEKGQNAALVPIFNKHHVDIVFQSHNHFYERFAPSACKNGGSALPCPVSGQDKGTLYITSGGGGAFLHFLVGGAGPARPAARAAHHFILVEINNHKLTLGTYGVGGSVVDSLSITKRPFPCNADGQTPVRQRQATP